MTDADDRTRRTTRSGPGEETPLPAEVSSVLAGWAEGDPPPGFADRVLGAMQREPAARRARRRWPIVALAVAITGAAVAVVGAFGAGGRAEQGARVVQARETIPLGARGVAVAEPGAELTWTIAAGGAAELHQARGDVFYRVEKGGPFVVETPYGQVMVRGTCFRVEVMNMSVSRQAWIGGAVGAALAATVVIAVYEGQVRVVNARGHVEAHPGDRVALGAGAPPTLLAGAPEPAPVEPPPATATVQELLARDQSHRGEIAQLRARVRALESGGPGASATHEPPAREGRYKMIDFSKEELAEMATRCEIRFDVPGYGNEPRLVTDKLAGATSMSADEQAIFNQTLRAQNDTYMAALRALYRELTGEPGDNLETSALFMEILRKSPSGDVEAARKELAAERAGLVPVPADTHNQSVVQRLFRLDMTAGDALERKLAAELGPERAHQIRAIGWPGGETNSLDGCPE
ncbi:MAG TPA: hypothetical protein VFK02_04290 [Kofleriaceae bacterium]|nr:hypothetical protein [Kofleriaceae bacterium]